MQMKRSWTYDEQGFAINPVTGKRFRYGDTFASLRMEGWTLTKQGKRHPRLRNAESWKKCNSNPRPRPCKQGPRRSANCVATNCFHHAKRRAHKKGLVFSITRVWVKTALDRAVADGSVVLHSRGDGWSHPRAPSIDRIIPKLGYTETNCRIIPLMLNKAKGEWDDKSFLDVLGPEIDRLRALHS